MNQISFQRLSQINNEISRIERLEEAGQLKTGTLNDISIMVMQSNIIQIQILKELMDIREAHQNLIQGAKTNG